ncbi:MAG: ankyrin repeat domain-containing protein [Bdellovibrionales bacterium]|nr:ankyrin repeat domain-containing protein [Bdellovibrionales bacterium]
MRYYLFALLVSAVIGCGPGKTKTALVHGDNPPANKNTYPNGFSAIQAGDVGAFEKMIEQGLDVNTADAEGKTFLMEAAEYKQVEVICLLLDSGADSKLVDKDGHDATWWAKGDQKVIEALSGVHCVEGILNKELVEAVNAKDWRQTKALLEEGADVNYKHQGTPVLILAVRTNHFGVVRVLVYHPRIQVEAMDTQGRTALDVAESLGNKRIIRLLKKAQK